MSIMTEWEPIMNKICHMKGTDSQDSATKAHGWTWKIPKEYHVEHLFYLQYQIIGTAHMCNLFRNSQKQPYDTTTILKQLNSYLQTLPSIVKTLTSADASNKILLDSNLWFFLKKMVLESCIMGTPVLGCYCQRIRYLYNQKGLGYSQEGQDT